MELGQLRALREVGDRGSIVAAAAALHVTASSVSQQLSALQRRAGVQLTFKDGRRTVLTDAGRELAGAALEVEVALERAGQAVARYRSEPVGVVSVAAFHSAAHALFGPLLAAHDGPRVILSDFDVAQEDFAGLTRRHDIVIAHRLVGSAPWPASVRVERLLFEPLDVVMREGHRLAGRRSVSARDLAGESWVAVHAGFPLEHAVAQIAGAGGSDARIVHRINDFAVAAAVVAGSDCVALVPRVLAGADGHPGTVLRPLAGMAPGRHIDCLVRHETFERTNVSTVLARLRTAVDRYL